MAETASPAEEIVVETRSGSDAPWRPHTVIAPATVESYLAAVAVVRSLSPFGEKNVRTIVRAAESSQANG